jgi:hypothetical protein
MVGVEVEDVSVGRDFDSVEESSLFISRLYSGEPFRKRG